jgi:hypothetical protein
MTKERLCDKIDRKESKQVRRKLTFERKDRAICETVCQKSGEKFGIEINYDINIQIT